MKIKIRVIISTIITLCIIMLTNTVQANYQSNNGTKVTAKPSDWATKIRKMEASNNVMGLTETINADGTFSGDSNNIDVHMMKNTEYGTATILATSREYGKPGSGSDRYVYSTTAGLLATTTGNVSGIYFDTKYYEWTAAGNTNFLASLASRYKNNYNNSTTLVFPGDAMNIWNWQKKSSGGNSAGRQSNAQYGYYRGSGGSPDYYPIFFYNASTEGNSQYSRAAIVNGKGF